MKSTIASVLLVTVLCTSTVGLAESKLYGSIRQTLLYTDTGVRSGDSDDIGVVDSSSRFGLHGSQQLGSVTGFGRWEWGVDATSQSSSPATRLGYAGLSGGFGTISFGSQWSAWDTFVGGDHTNFVSEGEWHNGTGRNGSTLKYAGLFGGVSVEADAVMVAREMDTTTEGVSDVANRGVLDEIQVAVGYGLDSITVQLAMIIRDGGQDGYLNGGNLFGARVSYDTGQLNLAFAIAHDNSDFGDDNNEKTTGVKLRASWETGPNTFLAVLTQADTDLAATSPRGIAVSYQYDLSKRSRVSLEMSSVDLDIAGSDATTEGGVMYRHDW